MVNCVCCCRYTSCEDLWKVFNLIWLAFSEMQSAGIGRLLSLIRVDLDFFSKVVCPNSVELLVYGMGMES